MSQKNMIDADATPEEISDDKLDEVSAGSGRRGELDHVGAYNFKVEIEGVSSGYFKGVDGLSTELETVGKKDGKIKV